jgi:photosystem II PsbU protein
MRILVRALLICLLAVGGLGFFNPHVSAAETTQYENAVDKKLTTEFGQKIDLNNSSIRNFRDLRGFYPNLASLIIKNAPYNSVNDVLSVAGLNDKQKELLQANLDKFTVTEPSVELTEGDDRYNPGVY